MISYESIKGSIILGTNNNQVNWLAIQVESINWIRNLDRCDLIIFDEISSILTHIGSNKNETNNNKIEMFINLINVQTTKIFMDAFMTTSLIKLV